jgi:hypothetical protein
MDSSENTAAQHHTAAEATQYLLCRLSDNPRQFTEPPLAAFRAAFTAGRDSGVMTIPF